MTERDVKTISIRDKAFPLLVAIASKTANKSGLLTAIGIAVQNVVRRRFLKHQAERPNKFVRAGMPGSRRSNFWAQVSRSTAAQKPGVHTVRVAVAHPAIAQKILGGSIRAKRVANLTIPLIPEAYDRRPSVFESWAGVKLFVWRSPRGTKFLAYRDPAGGLIRAYLLKAMVEQRPEGGVLPPTAEVMDAAIGAARAFIVREAQRAAANAK